MNEIDVSRVNKIMTLFAKRFRSKALSAVSLSHGRLVNLGRMAVVFSVVSHYVTVIEARG